MCKVEEIEPGRVTRGSDAVDDVRPGLAVAVELILCDCVVSEHAETGDALLWSAFPALLACGHSPVCEDVHPGGMQVLELHVGRRRTSPFARNM